VDNFLLGNNSEGWGNTSATVSDITGGVVACCHNYQILANGSLLPRHGGPWSRAPAPYHAYHAAGKQVLIIAMPGPYVYIESLSALQ
jgi:hypothetical protein